MVKISSDKPKPIAKTTTSCSSSTTASTSSSSSSSSLQQMKKKFKGVRMRTWGSWVSEIRAPNQKARIWLGSYSTAEAAARAYDAALLCLKGSSTNLNFPTNSYNIPQDTVLSPKSIQRFAASAAAASITSPDAALPTSSPSSSSSFVSSPSPSPSPCSDQIDDGVSLVQPLGAAYDEPMVSSMMDSWYSFEEPSWVNPQLSFNPLPMDDVFEADDIRLWSFNDQYS